MVRVVATPDVFYSQSWQPIPRDLSERDYRPPKVRRKKSPPPPVVLVKQPPPPKAQPLDGGIDLI
jgi:hypothetical protein